MAIEKISKILRAPFLVLQLLALSGTSVARADEAECLKKLKSEPTAVAADVAPARVEEKYVPPPARTLEQLRALALKPDQIHYQVYGDRGQSEAIVMIHGLTSNSRTWEETAQALSRDHKVITYDQRGNGLSAAVGTDYSSSLLATDLESLLNHLGITQAIVMGHSMGGRTAMRFSQLFPEKTRAVIIEDMHMLGRSKKLPDNLELSARLKALPRSFPNRQAADRALEPIFPQGAEGFIKYDLKEMPDGSFVMRGRPEVNVLYESQGLQEDLTDALKADRAPTLFISADPEVRGAVLFGKGVDNIRELRPDIEIKMIPGADHGIHSGKPKQFRAAVNRFLDGLSRAK